MLQYFYDAVKKSIEAYITRAGGYVFEVPLPFPLNSNDEIVTEFKKALEKGKANGRRVRLSVIDHITSMPCVVIPVKELVKICREEGVDQVFVDTAHIIGCMGMLEIFSVRRSHKTARSDISWPRQHLHGENLRNSDGMDQFDEIGECETFLIKLAVQGLN
ncbi:putative pyridoxal phosphate-dependent transferase [Rosa chinensis]|uniref:Putative pyridoxal phosphate-dependent transferase n=1 Tax=Rosa chinensis TaxID=74649 RepID=A0A2P6Q894_ROSCH|nr:putative pyridoxal phosphate-dependent transferase [Rosa chinensis]